MTGHQPSEQSSDVLKDEIQDVAEDGQNKFDLVLTSVRRLLRQGAVTNLGKTVKSLHLPDVARVISHLAAPQEKRTIFELVMGESEQGQVLSELDPDDIQQILENTTALEIADLLSYPKGTAGSIMTTEFFSLQEETTAQEAIRLLQQETKAETVFYIYTTNSDGHLTGVLSLRQLLTIAPTTSLSTILTRDVISVNVVTDQEEVARQVATYNLLAIPVVENDGMLVGIITVDDVVDVIREEDTEDMLKMAGAAEEDILMQSSTFEAARLRLPWLFTNLLGSLASGAILWYFRYTIQEVVAIVTFIPVIAAMGGNVGLQSSTLIIRGLATGRVELSDLWKVLFRELRIGLLLGVVCGALLTGAGLMWHNQGFLGMVVGLSLITAFLVSTGMATITPLLLKRYHVDPAVAAGPFVTTANDITGITIYLSLATVMLEFLR